MRLHTLRRYGRTITAAALLAAAVGAFLWSGGCTNDPFDPDSVPNHRPVASFYVTPQPGDTLSATSYYRRTFHWSGSDQDGFIESYHVSIQTDADVEAPWAVTTRTDTTITFTTDNQGRAFARLHVACRDDRGAMSDTLTQDVPLRNFPPVINFPADYDTTFWSYNAASFRFFALDLDGNETLSDTVIYYLDTADTTLSPVDVSDPAADPLVRPVKLAIESLDSGLFEIGVRGLVDAGRRTLTVIVADEADARPRFTWSWDVLPKIGDVLLVDDFAGDHDLTSFHAAMDSIFPAGWSLYDMEGGLPDRSWVLLETFREFKAVFWYSGSAVSENMGRSVDMLVEYLDPTDPAAAEGRLLLASKEIVGNKDVIPPWFQQYHLGINPNTSGKLLYMDRGKTIEDPRRRLPDMRTPSGASDPQCAFRVLKAKYPGKVIYEIDDRVNRDPAVGIMVQASDPSRAKVVTLCLQMENLQMPTMIDGLRAIFTLELGVIE